MIRFCKARIRRNRRNEQIVCNGGRQESCGIRDTARHVARIIDYRIPLSALQRMQPVIAIADKQFEIGKESVVGLAPIEQADHMSAP